MFHFPGFASSALYIQAAMTGLYSSRVSPFGLPWINARSQLPMDFRSLPRPSSLSDAKASTVCPLYLDPKFLPSVFKEQKDALKGIFKNYAVGISVRFFYPRINVRARGPEFFLRKEVIQPQVPLRLPCYDFTPITGHTFDGCLLAVSPPASGTTDFRGVTGGVYKARERIHRGIADPRLLEIPRSRSRVADSDPN